MYRPCRVCRVQCDSVKPDMTKWRATIAATTAIIISIKPCTQQTSREKRKSFPIVILQISFFLQNHHISPIRNIVRTISDHSYVGILDTYILPPSRCLSQGISHRVEHTHAQAYEVDTMPCHYHHQQTNITLSPSHSGSSSHKKNSRGDKKMYAIFFYIIIFIYEKKEEM